MLHTYDIADGTLREKTAGEGNILLFVAPTEAERNRLIEALQIDMHTLESALDPDEPTRLEFEPGHTAVIVKRPKKYDAEDDFLFKITSVGLFLFPDKLIIVLADDTLRFEGKLFRQITSLHDMMLKIISRATQHFEQHLRVVNKISGEIEMKINRAMENRHLLHLFTLEKSLVYYVNAISSNGRVIERLRAAAAKIGFQPEEMELLDDVAIENNQCLEVANTYSQVLAGLMDARASIVSNNLNVLMKSLTIIMLAVMVPQGVLGMFSMNVRMPFNDANSIAFWLIVGGSLVSALAVLWFWRDKK